MNKPYRSYSDHEIANYVLGIELSANTTHGIQHNLAIDNAAAAKALKWEAYFLSLTDGLKKQQPPEDILQNIQNTLGITIAAVDENASVVADTKPESVIQADETPKRFDSKFKLAIGLALIIVIGFIAWASLKAPVEQSMTQQTIDLVN